MLCCPVSVEASATSWSLVQRSPTRVYQDSETQKGHRKTSIDVLKPKLKLSHYTPRRRLGGEKYSSYSFSTSALDGGEWSASRLRPRFRPGERTPGTHCTGGWMGPREARGKILCLCRGLNIDRPVVQRVARHYTDWATRLTDRRSNPKKNLLGGKITASLSMLKPYFCTSFSDYNRSLWNNEIRTILDTCHVSLWRGKYSNCVVCWLHPRLKMLYNVIS
jgi:hypothetical protein